MLIHDPILWQLRTAWAALSAISSALMGNDASFVRIVDTAARNAAWTVLGMNPSSVVGLPTINDEFIVIEWLSLCLFDDLMVVS
jgi:hypothetical protein